MYEDVITDLTWKRDQLIYLANSAPITEQYNQAINLLRKAETCTESATFTNNGFHVADEQIIAKIQKQNEERHHSIHGKVIDTDVATYPPVMEPVTVEEFNKRGKSMFVLGEPGYNDDDMNYQVRMAVKGCYLPIHYTVHGRSAAEALYRAQRLALIMTAEIKKP